RPPERWFSQLDPGAASVTRMDRLALAGIRGGSLLGGRRLPTAEWAPPTSPDAPLDWARGRLAGGGLADGRSAEGGSVVLRTFASSAVRLAERARARDLDLTGLVIFSGGEPLTDARRRYIESTGARVFPRFVVTEAGLLAAACPHRVTTDSMHVYVDRLAMIEGDPGDAGDAGRAGEAGGAPTPLLLTTLTPDTGKVLFNTEMGDAGLLTRRGCPCAFGRLGFDLFVSQVSSRERLTLEGMTVPVRAVDASIAAVVESLGGSPDAWQRRVVVEESGSARLVVVIHPDLGPLDEAVLLADVHARLATAGAGLDVAADLWRQAGTIRVVREAPARSPGAKLPRGVTGARS
ncbi:MAG TPA: hypothetical protein VF720_16155, partial [Candidatus Eisenbacteria bacterium]